MHKATFQFSGVRPVLTSLLLLATAVISTAPGTPQTDPNLYVNPSLFEGLRYRSIGPHRGGRVTAVAGHRRQPRTFYMGATGGGVWKTIDAGHTWEPISDGAFATGSIGAIDVAESDPNTIYVGTGSAAIRSNVIQGRGVYKSVDGGRTWSFAGLREVGQIGSLRIHPGNPDIAFVAALGQPFGPNPERGVFRTKDGARTWQKVLFVDEQTGAVSLAINPSNPNEIYAGAWRGERRPWTIISGGPAEQCGLYKTTDGGDTWTKLSKGLPRKLIGKVDVDICRSNPSRVYAILEALPGEAGVYRSDDAGANWALVNTDPALLARPFYYTYIDVDPANPDVVWVNNLALWKSTDGGKNFRRVSTPHGDNHGRWINPDNPEIMIQSNDGGANVSLDGSHTWSTQYNQPTAEIYAVATDTQFPYRLYGAQQDNTTLIVPSRPPLAEGVDDPIQLWSQGPGCETGPIMPHPGKADVIYGACKGEFYRGSLRTGQIASYWVHPQNRYGHNPKDIKYRFQRVSPLEVSPHNPDVVYYCSHMVHRSMDQGVTWETISPDLTANEADKQVLSGEPITRDITGEEVYSTLYSFRESRLEPGVLWAGSNDGPVHVSRDNGKTWIQVTPKDLPAGGRVQNIEPSPHRKGSAYIAVYRYLLDDWRPYIYLTNDYGATWKRLTDGKNGVPDDYPTRVVREDPARPGLLYAGTEFGIFISFDNGEHWQSFQQNLPVTPVTDIQLHRNDLVLSTMGRSFWIMDNVTPLHQIRSSMEKSDAHLFQPREAYRTRHPAMGGRPDYPTYPPVGADIDFYLAASPAGAAKLEILDPRGNVIRHFASDDSTRVAGLPIRKGMNRFAWDLRHEGAWDSNPQRSGANGPPAIPGRYQVRLSTGNWTQTQPLEIKLDPRLPEDGVTQADLNEQLELNLRIRDTMSEARRTVSRIAEALKKGGPEETARKLRALQAELVTASGPYPQPMFLDQLNNLYSMVNGADRRVGRSAFAFFDELKKQLAGIQGDLAQILP